MELECCEIHRAAILDIIKVALGASQGASGDQVKVFSGLLEVSLEAYYANTKPTPPGPNSSAGY